jgi:hypothetical protein
MYTLHIWTKNGQWCVFSQGIDGGFLPFRGCRAARIFRTRVSSNGYVEEEITHRILEFQRLWRRFWARQKALQSMYPLLRQAELTGLNLQDMYLRRYLIILNETNLGSRLGNRTRSS